MDIVHDILEVGLRRAYLVLTVGSFDGVHRGHLRILAEVVRIAGENDGVAAVMTMCPHPREFFSPEHAPNLLTPEKKKQELIEKAGVDLLISLPFTREVAELDHAAFLERVLARQCRARHVVVGHDFRFGKDALGDYHSLRHMGPTYGFQVTQVAPFILDGERVSSTAIRERLLEGDLDKAEAFLGRKYSVMGEVIPGRGIGATLGFPTANVKPHHSAIPAQGVYVGEVFMRGEHHPAAVNIGIAPTIAHDETVIEAFLFDFHEDIHGLEIEIVFHKRLRPEKKFASREALVQAIRDDVAAVRAYWDRQASLPRTASEPFAPERAT